MGAWGSGSFENDSALDFVSEIESAADVERAFTAAGSENIELDEGCSVIVAAECVAAMRGHPATDLPDELAGKIADFGKCPIALYDKARENLSAVMSRGELVDLWAEEGSGDWNRAVTELMERLNKPAASAKKARKRKKAPAPNPSPCIFCDKPMGDGAFHMLDITIHEDDISSSRQGGWVHLQCLNAALHPKHMFQTWDFDDELLDFVMKKLKAQDARES